MIRKIVWVIAVALSMLSYTLVSAVPIVEQAPRNVVIRSTQRLYWNNECITLYRGGKCLLTMGDNVVIEGTYSIEDEGNWIYFYFGENRVAARCTISGGSIKSISYNGNVYRAK